MDYIACLPALSPSFFRRVRIELLWFKTTLFTDIQKLYYSSIFFNKLKFGLLVQQIRFKWFFKKFRKNNNIYN